MNKDFLQVLGLQEKNHGTSTGLESSNLSQVYIDSYSPVDGEYIGSVSITTREQYDQVIQSAESAFKIWREMPAPKRGEIVRQASSALVDLHAAVARLSGTALTGDESLHAAATLALEDMPQLQFALARLRTRLQAQIDAADKASMPRADRHAVLVQLAEHSAAARLRLEQVVDDLHVLRRGNAAGRPLPAMDQYLHIVEAQGLALDAAPDAAAFANKTAALTNKVAQIEQRLGEGPYFAGDRFSLVDAAFAPAFRYFDVFDTIAASPVQLKRLRQHDAFIAGELSRAEAEEWQP